MNPRRISTLALLVAFALAVGAKDFKQQAKTACEQERYPAAIALMQRALDAHSQDAETWYLLGRMARLFPESVLPLHPEYRAAVEQLRAGKRLH